eukprot:TRINITY_DN3003_c0_g1_i1.p1 TRINITY_DN3003_c0_g1~~TRINITY_DN3003_c0_g1_i1.p1  ORF type:complete len:456 (-),score=108.02 TRINITY_DN3003_c0_g1_i1:63-1430(-)
MVTMTYTAEVVITLVMMITQALALVVVLVGIVGASIPKFPIRFHVQLKSLYVLTQIAILVFAFLYSLSKFLLQIYGTSSEQACVLIGNVIPPLFGLTVTMMFSHAFAKAKMTQDQLKSIQMKIFGYILLAIAVMYPILFTVYTTSGTYKYILIQGKHSCISSRSNTILFVVLGVELLALVLQSTYFTIPLIPLMKESKSMKDMGASYTRYRRLISRNLAACVLFTSGVAWVHVFLSVAVSTSNANLKLLANSFGPIGAFWASLGALLSNLEAWEFCWTSKQLSHETSTSNVLSHDIVEKRNDEALVERYMRHLQVFLERQFAMENLRFLEAVKLYKEKFDRSTDDENLEAAKSVFQEFCKSDSPSAVNISANNRADLAQKFTAVENPTVFVGIFDNACAEVFMVLATDSLRRFEYSPEYASLMAYYGGGSNQKELRGMVQERLTVATAVDSTNQA